MFESSLTTISKPKPKCSQLAELHKVDDYLGPRFSSVFLLCFQPCWPCREALLARDSENITVTFENTKQNSTLLRDLILLQILDTLNDFSLEHYFANSMI